jgi:hypothetical protein
MSNQENKEVIIIELPKDIHERRRKLESLLSNTYVEEVKVIFKEILEKYKDKIAEHNNGDLPKAFEFTFIWEYNDEGGSDPWIDGIYLYGKNGELDIEFPVEYKSQWSDTIYEEELYYLLKDEICSIFDGRSLEEHLGERRYEFD